MRCKYDFIAFPNMQFRGMEISRLIEGKSDGESENGVRMMVIESEIV